MTRLTKLGLVSIVLILIIPLSWKLTGLDPTDIDPQHPWRLRKTDPKIGRPVFYVPRPIGPKDAPVKLKVFVTSHSDCDAGTVPAIRQLASKHEGKVYAEFIDLTTPEGAKQGVEAKISCQSGMTINGQNQFTVPGRAEPLILNGPLGKHDYTFNDVDGIVERLIQSPNSLQKPTSPPSKPTAQQK